MTTGSQLAVTRKKGRVAPSWAELGARCGQLVAGTVERRGKGVLGQAGRARASGPEGRSGELG